MQSSLIGVGLRSCHLEQFYREKPDIGWVEVHSENYYSLGGKDFDYLCKIRNNYPISLHGLGMSLGSHDGIDMQHISDVKGLIDVIDPFLVSDHLSWNSTNAKFLPDLLPTPFNQESIEVFARNISKVQEILGREILLENPSTYFEFNESTMPEYEFLNEIIKKTGAKIILDVNNIYISALNNGWSSIEYIKNIAGDSVREIHLSGHSIKLLSSGEKLYIDSHNDYVSDEVWSLYDIALSRFGIIPTLLEWDEDIPELSVLLDEAKKAEKYLTTNFKEDMCLV